MWRIVVGDSARSVADADFQTVVKSMRLSDTTIWYHPGVHTPPKRCLRDVTGGCACVPMLCKVACSVWHHATLPSRAGRTRGRRPELDINRLDGSLVHTNVLVLSLHSLNHSPSKRSACPRCRSRGESLLGCSMDLHCWCLMAATPNSCAICHCFCHSRVQAAQ